MQRYLRYGGTKPLQEEVKPPPPPQEKVKQPELTNHTNAINYVGVTAPKGAFKAHEEGVTQPIADTADTTKIKFSEVQDLIKKRQHMKKINEIMYDVPDYYLDLNKFNRILVDGGDSEHYMQKENEEIAQLEKQLLHNHLYPFYHLRNDRGNIGEDVLAHLENCPNRLVLLKR